MSTSSTDPTRFEDRIAINELVQRYGSYVDHCQLDELLGLFSEDAILDASSAGMGVARGIGEIRGLYEREFKVRIESMHHTTTHFADFESETEASGTTYVLIYANFQGSESLRSIRTSVLYADRYVKVDGQWRFQARVLKPITAFDRGGIPGEALKKIDASNS